MGLGATSLREALYELERQWVCHRRCEQRCLCHSAFLEDTQQVYRVAMELEGMAVEPLKKHIKPSDLQALQKLIDIMRTPSGFSQAWSVGRRDEVPRDIKKQNGARVRVMEDLSSFSGNSKSVFSRSEEKRNQSMFA